ncbi:hypothetical protein [Acinetobacter sp. UBA2581]|uniref:hypothetical protein n=1 Tax=Acinetobacter sp. UBA2581 TaxID=1945932 RepID=UPI00257D7A82|nr:hypothetical protein [Acinetobacter sp. UBA2581]
MEDYKVSFYIDNEKLDLECEGIFKANNKVEAIDKAAKELSPTDKGFNTVLIWGRPD